MAFEEGPHPAHTKGSGKGQDNQETPDGAVIEDGNGDDDHFKNGVDCDGSSDSYFWRRGINERNIV